ncbi:MAG TPA: hypothetical protein VG944_03030 [Fimbriimonas sp.]|nr:hypothetical protein [Fimbriimonas sp.]
MLSEVSRLISLTTGSSTLIRKNFERMPVTHLSLALGASDLELWDDRGAEHSFPEGLVFRPTWNFKGDLWTTLCGIDDDCVLVGQFGDRWGEHAFLAKPK